MKDLRFNGTGMPITEAQFESQDHISHRKFADGYSTDGAPHAICLAAIKAVGFEI